MSSRHAWGLRTSPRRSTAEWTRHLGSPPPEPRPSGSLLAEAVAPTGRASTLGTSSLGRCPSEVRASTEFRCQYFKIQFQNGLREKGFRNAGRPGRVWSALHPGWPRAKQELQMARGGGRCQAPGVGGLRLDTRGGGGASSLLRLVGPTEALPVCSRV